MAGDGPQDFLISTADIGEGAALGGIHRLVFDPAWGGDVFEQFLMDQQIITLVVRNIVEDSKICGFVLCRYVLEEAEIITFAVHPKWQHQGLGSLLMQALLQRLYQQHVQILFLDVATDNEAALAVYRRLGFVEIGRRRGYYYQFGHYVDALTMQLRIA